MLHFVFQADERGHRRVFRPLHLGDDRTKGWPTAGWPLRPKRMTGEADVIGMLVTRPHHGANRRGPMHLPRDFRQHLGNLDTRHAGRDRLELTANLPRRVHLQVVHVLMRRAAREVDHDDGFLPLTPARIRRGLKQFRQRQSTHAQTTNFQKITAAQAVTKTAG